MSRASKILRERKFDIQLIGNNLSEGLQIHYNLGTFVESHDDCVKLANKIKDFLSVEIPVKNVYVESDLAIIEISTKKIEEAIDRVSKSILSSLNSKLTDKDL